MKKIYKKPQILFCDFELSENISAGCEMIANLSRDTACGVEIPGWGMTYFSGKCDISDPMFEDELCYHVPTDKNNVFGS